MLQLFSKKEPVSFMEYCTASCTQSQSENCTVTTVVYGSDVS